MELDDMISMYKRLSIDDQNKLKALLLAKHFFNLAVDEDSSSAYSEAFQYAEKALKYSPYSAEMQYIAGISRLKAWGDKNYASNKYKLLMTLGPEGVRFAEKLKPEVR
jgi:two-component SAPR family response regulator